MLDVNLSQCKLSDELFFKAVKLFFLREWGGANKKVEKFEEKKSKENTFDKEKMA